MLPALLSAEERYIINCVSYYLRFNFIDDLFINTLSVDCIDKLILEDVEVTILDEFTI